MLFLSIIGVLGGITVFLLGLRLISRNMGLFVTGRLSSAVYKATDNVFSAVGIGAGVTAFAQSSVAINMVVVSLVDGGAIPMCGACAVVIGTNVGTTITAQLTSFSFGTFDVAAIGALIAFIGFLLSALSDEKAAAAGGIMLGFGLVFMGIEILTEKAQAFYGYEWFGRFFLIDSPAILLLNGFIITAVCQSSSVVSSMLVILSAGGLIPFEHSVFMILGSNIGSTICVMLFSAKKSLAARKVAFFNFLFNLFGAAIFTVIMLFFGGQTSLLFTSTSRSAGRAVANFHTFFNVASGVIALPFLKPLTKLCDVFIKERGVKVAAGGNKVSRPVKPERKGILAPP